MYFWPFLQHYMGEIIYFQRCNAPNGPNISSIIVKTYAKLKKSFRLVVLGYTWYFLIWGGLSLAPNPGKFKFLIGFLSKFKPIQYQCLIWTEFPVKIWARLMKFKWGFGLMCHMITPSIPALPIHVFWTSYVFLKEYSCGISFSGASSSKQYGFSAFNLSYFAKFKYILMQPHRSEFGASWSQYCQTIGTVISDVILKPVQSDLVCATLYSGQISAL